MGATKLTNKADATAQQIILSNFFYNHSRHMDIKLRHIGLKTVAWS